MKITLMVLLMFFLVACQMGSPVLQPPAPTNPLQSIPIVPASTMVTRPSQAHVQTDNPQPIPTATTGLPITSNEFPDPQRFTWKLLVDGLDSPVGMAHAGDGTGRLFILEQKGVIRIIRSGELSSQAFLDIQDRVGSNGSEQGLLGIAFHPSYVQNGYIYLNYTDKSGNSVIARFQVSERDPNQADPASEKRLMFIEQPFSNHNGGALAFGPEGYLYIGLGDGGSGGDPQGNAQSLNSPLGKILRIDLDSGDPYSIPQDNPFPGGPIPEIWAYGLRNPWRFSFDRQTGDLYIGDVGQNAWEEINLLLAGSLGGVNFGWNFMEATHPYNTQAIPADLQTALPLLEYPHQGHCSVTGGYVYRGESLPEWQGIYFFGDYCSGSVWGIQQKDSQGAREVRLLFEDVGNISSFGEDEAGELYVLNIAGTVSQLVRK